VFPPDDWPLHRGDTRDLTLGGEAGLQQVVVGGGWKEMPAGTEVIGDGAEGGEELLGVLGGLEALEHALSSSCGPVRILRPIIEAFVPPVLDPRQHPA
jgi:hypothetical protein